jgi:hypothetical protein
MLNSYHSNCYWNKAERFTREEPTKSKRRKNFICFFFLYQLIDILGFVEQLSRQNPNRHLSRDNSTLDFLLYIFDAIDLLRTNNV